MPEETKKEAKNSKESKPVQTKTHNGHSTQHSTPQHSTQTPAQPITPVVTTTPEIKPTTESKSNPWMLAAILFLAIAIVLGIMVANDYKSSKVVSKEIAAQEVSTFIKDSFGIDMQTDSVTEKNDLYEMTYSFSGRKFILLSTKDLSFIRLPNGNWVKKSEVEVTNETTSPSDSPSQEIDLGTETKTTKSAKPKVELFVMSLCPYTLQTEKGIIPAIEALKDKIDFKIRYMHYVLEGSKEDAENKRQICIREEQSSKFLPYLKCFTNSSNSTSCVKSLAIDQTKLDSCVKGKASNYYLNDSQISKSKNIELSPTLIINGNKADLFPRDSTTALGLLCSAFTTKPAECNNKLSTQNPSAAFGTGSENTDKAGFCG